MPPPPLDDLLATALTAATGAADLLRTGFGQRRAEVGTKSSPTDMVTDMDRAAEAHIAAALAARRPHDAMLSEEGTARAGDTGVRWVVDPLDGTTNYLFGVPAYSVSVAAEFDGSIVVGVVVDPSRQETWTAVRGEGAFRNGQPLRLVGPDVSPPPSELSTALIATGFSYLPERRAEQAAVLVDVLPRVRDIRRFGSAAIDLCWVAGGRFHGYYEWGMHRWDVAAGRLIAEEAGAETAELPDGTVVVTAPGLLGPLLNLLQSAGAGRASST
ncbi:MAG TPA: inositol monophosphatase family protein [Acidimicrobiales bacterium]|nr:inositol monophosphatase family protein [Acidimicrobiales bacterium]